MARKQLFFGQNQHWNRNWNQNQLGPIYFLKLVLIPWFQVSDSIQLIGLWVTSAKGVQFPTRVISTMGKQHIHFCQTMGYCSSDYFIQWRLPEQKKLEDILIKGKMSNKEIVSTKHTCKFLHFGSKLLKHLLLMHVSHPPKQIQLPSKMRERETYS